MSAERKAAVLRPLQFLPARWKFTLPVLVFLNALDACFQGLLPVTVALLLDQWESDQWGSATSTGLLLRPMGVVALAVLFVTGAGMLRDSLSAGIRSGVLRTLRQAVFERLQRISFQPESAPDLSATDWAWERGLNALLPSAVESIVYTCLIFWVDWRAGLLCLLFWPWTLLSSRRIVRNAIRAADEGRAEEKHTFNAMEELLAAQPEIRAYSLEQVTSASFRKRNRILCQKASQAAFLTAFAARFTRFGTLMLLCAVVALSFTLLSARQITPGMLLCLTFLPLMLGQSLALLARALPALRDGRASLARLEEELSDPDAVLDAPGAQRLPPFSHEIVFAAVDSGASLTGVNLRIPRGSYIAVVGTGAAGKTTLLDLLLRFRDPSAGAVSIDGTDLRSVTQASVRAQMGIVQQENFVFNATLRENISLGRPDASEEVLADTAKACGLDGWLAALPRGLDTLAGTKGLRPTAEISQRLALARAMIRDPAILALDDIAASLSPSEEDALLATIRQLAPGRTVISFSHRLASVPDAGSICVLQHGNVVEQGSHPELLAQSGYYAGLWQKQSGFRFTEDGSHVEVGPQRLKLIPPFASLSDLALAEVAAYFDTGMLPPEREIVREHDPANKLYILVRGKAQFCQTDAEPVPLEDGDFFGTEALSAGSFFEGTVRTTTACFFITLERCHYEQAKLL